MKGAQMLAFDPISWAAGYLLTKATEKGLALAYPQTLRRDLEKEIKDWAVSVSKSAYIHPATLFSVVSASDENVDARPALKQLRHRLMDLVIPSKEEWLDCLVEQWLRIRQELGEQAQEFFKLTVSEAKTELAQLAKQIYQRCCQDQKTALPHMVKSLDRIEVTLEELRQLHTLKVISREIISSDTILKTTKVITDIARKMAIARGWPYCWELHIETGDKTSVLLVFGKTDSYEPVTGLMTIDEEQLVMWSSLEGNVLSSAISGTMFGMPLFTEIEENWNSMVEFVGLTARALYPNSVRDGAYGISARHDLKRIGVPFPVGCEVDETDDSVTMLKLEHEGGLVPFLTFGTPKLNELIGVGEVDAAGRIAEWLFEKWGPATLIPK